MCAVHAKTWLAGGFVTDQYSVVLDDWYDRPLMLRYSKMLDIIDVLDSRKLKTQGEVINPKRHKAASRKGMGELLTCPHRLRSRCHRQGRLRPGGPKRTGRAVSR
jgi:hypothetical protein